MQDTGTVLACRRNAAVRLVIKYPGGVPPHSVQYVIPPLEFFIITSHHSAPVLATTVIPQ